MSTSFFTSNGLFQIALYMGVLLLLVKPLGGMVPMLFMKFGEVIYGGVGSGLYGMLIFAIITVFIAGLMVGRTPEYLGKKINAFEIKMASIAILMPCLLILVGTAIAVMTDAGKAGMLSRCHE